MLFGLQNCLTYLFYLIGCLIFGLFVDWNHYIFQKVYSNLPKQYEYEYIIVGTGTAGSIIAAGIPSGNVLILEAGNMRNSIMDIPILQPLLQGTKYDWGYETEAQLNSCLGLKGSRSKWPMGKIYGGTHMLNNMIHFDGNLNDFTDWFESNEDLEIFLKYFDSKNDKFINTESLKFQSSLAKSLIKASEEAGFEKGTFYVPKISAKNGSRWTASHYNYEYPRTGHDLVLNAFVTKLIIQDDTAVGVEFGKNGIVSKVYAAKHVILSAGVIGSPKLLMLSGCGPKLHLEEAGIGQVRELPVGLNLQDHVTTGMDLILLNRSLNLQPFDLLHPKNIYNYFIGSESSLSLPGCELLGFVDNLGFMVLPVGAVSDHGAHLKTILNLKDAVWEQYYQKIIDKRLQTVTVLPILLNPKSRGTLKLKNSDQNSTPIIEPNYLSVQDDIETLIKGIKIIKRIVETESMQKLGAEVNPLVFPGCQDYDFDTDPYWECYIKHLTLTIYHPVGTCSMGHVVSNHDFQVFGIKNLYVVDGSIIPKSPSGNPNSVIAALAHYFLKINFNVEF